VQPVAVQPFDSIAARAVARELGAALRGARIEKVFQPDRLELALVLRGRGRQQVLLSARGPFSRVHLTERKLAAPARPAGFVMLLRKYLEGGRIREVAQPGLERVLAFEVETRDDLGDPAIRTLVAELTGSHSNLVLLGGPWQAGAPILAALRPVTAQMSRVRQIEPGLPYEPPPIDRDRQDPLTGDPLAALAVPGSLAKALQGRFHSLSRHAIAQILQIAGLAPDRPAAGLDAAERDRLVAAWTAAMAALHAGAFFPRLVVGQPWDYALLPPTLDPVPPTAEGAAASRLLDGYYRDRWDAQVAEGLRAQISRRIADEVAKVDSRLDQARQTVARAESADEYRRWGDLLLTWQNAVPGGAAEASLADPATGATVVVPLDPSRSVADNAQRHYRTYKKYLAARRIQESMLEGARAEAAWWRDRQADLDRAENLADLRALEAAVSDEPAAAGAGRPGQDAGPERYRSADGLEILVGRNNRQNDLLTGRLARPEDWWFHAQKAPGSHVVVRAPSATAHLPEKTCLQAALLAAWYSKARTDTRVPVAYTRRKYVRRKPGAAPGFVTYDHERILLVTPDSADLAGILRLN